MPRPCSADGCVLIQRERQGGHENLPREATGAGGARRRRLPSRSVGEGTPLVTVEYVFPHAVWTQTYRTRPFTPEEFERELERAHLKSDRTLTGDG
ncbi:hypothetical protein [Streptomyces beihaiensis]|uniref:Uncharacterized protein n=1 Tax=Streptomyces beihaiensis TaxID=2984495 RepID=A0ABT3U4L4_9ACTN|nr:hypothetical protein [Streptomyces beihaiensis]MCX3064229.1 hypothetical protein [Streptomyces beihaiensis]